MPPGRHPQWLLTAATAVVALSWMDWATPGWGLPGRAGTDWGAVELAGVLVARVRTRQLAVAGPLIHDPILRRASLVAVAVAAAWFSSAVAAIDLLCRRASVWRGRPKFCPSVSGMGDEYARWLGRDARLTTVTPPCWSRVEYQRQFSPWRWSSCKRDGFVSAGSADSPGRSRLPISSLGLLAPVPTSSRLSPCWRLWPSPVARSS